MELHASRRYLVLSALLVPAALLCPLGEFVCGNLSQCVAQKLICNDVEDCPNGADEENCTQRIPDSIIPSVRVVAPYKWPQPFNSCALEKYPAVCKCRRMTWLYCKSANLTHVPPDVSPEVTRLNLNNNSITSISEQDFEPYPNLLMVNFEGNFLERLENNTFCSAPSLKSLFIKGNRLSVLEVGAFNCLHNLTWLTLQENHLVDLNPEVFADLPSLSELDLRNNRLHIQGGMVFPPMPSLVWVMLEGNDIEVLEAGVFSSLDFLQILNLAGNRIWAVHEDAFTGLISLNDLDLGRNQLRHLTATFLKDVNHLSKLKLNDNPLTSLPHGLFSAVQNLTLLNLEGIEINNMHESLFSGLPQLQFAYFKKFHYCTFVPHVRVCRPNTDGISSIENLLGRQIQRFSVWVVAILTCVGNAGVLCGRIMARGDNRIDSLFIGNLAAADLFMGIYLLVIGSHDLFYRNHFNQHARSWMASWRCKVTGVLAMMSSEASMLILATVSLQRCVCISSAFHKPRHLGLGMAMCILFTVWGTSLILAVFPILHWSQQSDNVFYGSNGLCFPLHIDDPFLVGWQYSVFVFVGVNGCGVLLISYAYLALCDHIRRSSSTPYSIKEKDFAFRFLIIVATDCLCWIPIILLKLVALTRTAISADLYAWVVVFILPINSALNPFIYTFTTRPFRSRVNEAFTKQFLIRAWPMTSNRKDSGDTEPTSASSKRSLPKSTFHQVPPIGQDYFHFAESGV